MKPTILTIRAIGAEFANRLWLPIIIIFSILSIGLYVLVWWVSTVAGSLWLLLDIPLTIVVSVGFGILTLFKLVIRHVRPKQTKTQAEATSHFVDSLESVSDAVQTPKVVLLFYIVKDIAAANKDGYIANMIHTSSSLKSDFIALQNKYR